MRTISATESMERIRMAADSIMLDYDIGASTTDDDLDRLADEIVDEYRVRGLRLHRAAVRVALEEVRALGVGVECDAARRAAQMVSIRSDMSDDEIVSLVRRWCERERGVSPDRDTILAALEDSHAVHG